MSQRQLASNAGCTQSYLAKVERGKVIPNYLLAGRLFHAIETEERRGQKTVRDVMHAPVISFERSDTVADAANVARERGVSQFPILWRGHSIGSVTTKQLLGVDPHVQLGRIMGPALPTVGPNASVNAVRPLLREEQPAVIVLDKGEIVGIVTAEDLL